MPLNETLFLWSQLSRDLKVHRRVDLNITLDEAAKRTRISKATLSRVENGLECSIETFARIIRWMRKEPCDYFPNSHQF